MEHEAITERWRQQYAAARIANKKRDRRGRYNIDAAFNDERLEDLLDRWFSDIVGATQRQGFSSSDGDTVDEQERKERAGEGFTRDVCAWWKKGRRLLRTSSVVQQIISKWEEPKKVAACYRKDISTVTRWASGRTEVPNDIYEDIRERWGDKCSPP